MVLGSSPVTEVCKTLNSLNPDFMNTYFWEGSHSARGKNDLAVNMAETLWEEP